MIALAITFTIIACTCKSPGVIMPRGPVAKWQTQRT